MKMTSENGNFQTWNHGEEILVRVNTKGDIVIIKLDNGEQELIKRVPYTVQSMQMIADFYNGELDPNFRQPGKTSKTHHINSEAWVELENWDRMSIEMIDPETAFIREAGVDEGFPISSRHKGNGGRFSQTSKQPLPSGTRWTLEDYNEGYLLHLESEITIHTLLESVDGPAIHIYRGAYDITEEE